MRELKVIFGMIPKSVISTSSYFDLNYFTPHKRTPNAAQVEIFAHDSGDSAKLAFLKCNFFSK